MSAARGKGAAKAPTERDAALTIRVTIPERDAMHAAADASGLTLSGWLRAMALREARRAAAKA